MTSTNGPPGAQRRVAFSLRIRRRRRRVGRRGQTAGAVAAPVGAEEKDAPAFQRLRRAAASRGGWGLAALLAVGVAIGLGWDSRNPEGAAVGAERPPRPANPAPAQDIEPDRRAPVSLREEYREPSIFLEHPPSIGLPEPGEHEVLCIRKPVRSERTSIEQIGGRRRDGSPWRVDRDLAITGVKEGRWSFHVGSGDAAAAVIVDVSRAGNEILKTRPDRREDNNLLSLPECP